LQQQIKCTLHAAFSPTTAIFIYHCVFPLCCCSVCRPKANKEIKVSKTKKNSKKQAFVVEQN